MAAFRRLREAHKRWGERRPPGVSAEARVGQQLARCPAAACRQYFQQCRVLCLACYAFRVGGKDVLL
eukprot:13095444-Alexandrium_andersonii.AAC.1